MGGMPDPSQMGQQMPPQGPSMPPQGPSMPGQPTAIQPGQAVMGGMQPGMDPSQQQQQPPGATMTADDGSVESLMNQVNPQFMEQAGNLNDAGAFDAACRGNLTMRRYRRLRLVVVPAHPARFRKRSTFPQHR